MVRKAGGKLNLLLTCSLSASSAIFAFSTASILRLVRFVILRSVCCDGTAPNPISQPVPNPGPTSRGDRQQIGVIAREVERVYPQAVTASPEGMKSVNFNMLIPPLIEAVKELKAANDNLTARVEALEAKR